MIKGIGIDVVELQRFKNMPDRKAFLEQVLSQKEIFETQANSDLELATTFAIKEATLKALGCGLSVGSLWHEVEISSMTHVTLRGTLRAIADSLSITKIRVCHSHSQHVVMASALLE